MSNTIQSKFNMVTIIGPTASGKTSLAAEVAYRLNSGIISADSRQVYQGMDIGTGKDLADYCVHGTTIPYYLIDIVEAGEKYNVYEFQNDFMDAYNSLQNDGKLPVLCGGSGMYVEAVVKGYNLISVPINNDLRAELENKSMDELVGVLNSLKQLHNTTDCVQRKRLIRAIEIETYKATHSVSDTLYPKINSLFIGIDFDRETRRERISNRLNQRLREGMVAEVETLLKQGVTPESLIYYGLEYKFITLYLTGQLAYNEMVRQLEIAIHQFAKRQMTWFRKMERDGIVIHWLDGNWSVDQKANRVIELLNA